VRVRQALGVGTGADGKPIAGTTSRAGAYFVHDSGYLAPGDRPTAFDKEIDAMIRLRSYVWAERENAPISCEAALTTTEVPISDNRR
jgi:hypothetical protein